jgi:GMC oxidoreductase
VTGALIAAAALIAARQEATKPCLPREALVIDNASSLAPGAEVSADICIVGSGAAGITLALKLLDTGKKILLLESSAQNMPVRLADERARFLQIQGTYPREFAFERDPRCYDPVAQSLNRGVESADMADFDPLFLERSRLRAYGGTTNCWGGWTRPLDAIDFDRSDLNPSDAWPISRDAIYPRYYNAAMDMCSMPGIGVERYDDESFWRKHVSGGGEFLDLGAVTDGAMRNAIFLPMNRSTLDFHTVWGPILEKAGNCRILRNANLRDVVGGPGDCSVDHLRASAIIDRKHGVDFTVKAGQYIMATGGTEVVRLLLHSAPNGFANAHDWLGRCFLIHPTNELFISYTQGPRVPSEQVVNLYTRQIQVPIGQTPPSLIAAMAPTEAHLRRIKLRNFRIVVNLLLRTVNLSWEQAPNVDSRLRLAKAEKDPYFGDPLAHLDWHALPVDTTDTPAKAFELIASTLGVLGFADQVTRSRLVIPWAGDHHMGATRMSARPENGYVDVNCRVHGSDNLYIASSSVFPSVGFANPTLTIIALAARLADHLAGRPN